MPIFFLLAAGLALVLIGVGIVLALVAVAAVAVMVALGVTSSAVVIGLLRRRVSSGLRAFHYPICGLIGIPAGVVGVGFARWLLEMDMRRWEVLAIGALGGACAGLILAFALDWLARVIYQRLALETR